MEDDKPLRRRRRWFIALGAIAGLAIIQSVTFTPAVEVRYVDKESGAPIDGLTVTSVWHLHAITPAGSLNSRVLRVQALKTDADGSVRIPAVVMFHPPAFPFGLDVREIDALPVLYISDQRYPDIAAGSRWDNSPSFSLLLFQKTSIDETIVKLTNVEAHPSRDREDGRNLIAALVRQAYASCGRSTFCRVQEVAP
jgi:hypothetical protein